MAGPRRDPRPEPRRDRRREAPRALRCQPWQPRARSAAGPVVPEGAQGARAVVPPPRGSGRAPSPAGKGRCRPGSVLGNVVLLRESRRPRPLPPAAPAGLSRGPDPARPPPSAGPGCPAPSRRLGRRRPRAGAWKSAAAYGTTSPLSQKCSPVLLRYTLSSPYCCCSLGARNKFGDLERHCMVGEQDWLDQPENFVLSEHVLEPKYLTRKHPLFYWQSGTLKSNSSKVKRAAKECFCISGENMYAPKSTCGKY
ncbi:serine/arginine repetitive matrix protein 1-like [Corvus hawaiiensis]|uniref:serine/arginine repetitive matrix protein 1-like n=1 Tax=Corvus hawaiiensis TaxID=134902 RepID=UPI0020198AC0|nr:serine/arginine repetitive matrix protein 1-like [Corvus hawaiiensis]